MIPLLFMPRDTGDYRYLSFHIPPFKMLFHDPLLRIPGVYEYYNSIVSMRPYKMLLGVYGFFERLDFYRMLQQYIILVCDRVRFF